MRIELKAPRLLNSWPRRILVGGAVMVNLVYVLFFI